MDTKNARNCIGCTQCCVVMGVHELKKPCYQTCKRLTETGCGRYKDRPLSCAGYKCGWLEGADVPSPKESNLIFNADSTVTFGYEVWESAAGAWDNAKYQERILAYCLKYGALRLMVYRFNTRVGMKFKTAECYEDRDEYGKIFQGKRTSIVSLPVFESAIT